MKPKSCSVLLKKFHQKTDRSQGEFLPIDQNFDHRKRLCVYNPTKPIPNNQTGKMILGRVEPLDSEISKLCVFEEQDGIWQRVPRAPIFKLQDPFYAHNIHGWQILGGVRVKKNLEGILEYRTVFYRYKKHLRELIGKNGRLKQPFAKGPIGMKDIRLIELHDGKIGVFTRPQGGEARRGRIGYIEIEKLSKLEESIPQARLINNLFAKDEWGGANELHLLSKLKIGVLGHIAHFDGQGLKHYYAISFIFDRRNATVSDLKILTTADDFPSLKPKTDQMGKIIFSGGLERKSDGRADLYVGIGDVKAGKVNIADPFTSH